MFFIIGFSLLLFLAQSENFIEYYQKEFWKRSFDFDGETSRKSFWTVFGWNLLIELILVFIGLGTSLESSKKELSNYFVLVPFYGYCNLSNSKYFYSNSSLERSWEESPMDSD